MKMSVRFGLATAGLLALCITSQSAGAVTVDIASQDVTTIPTTNFITAPVSTTGTFVLSTTGTIANVQRSPYEGTAIASTPYSALAVGGSGPSSATYNIGAFNVGLLWGSPDSYNFIDFYTGLNGTGTLIRTVTGTDLVPPATTAFGFDFVTFTSNGGQIGSIVLRDSGQAAFEFSDIAPVPIPGALPLFATGLGGLCLLMRGRRKKVEAVAA